MLSFAKERVPRARVFLLVKSVCFKRYCYIKHGRKRHVDTTNAIFLSKGRFFKRTVTNKMSLHMHAFFFCYALSIDLEPGQQIIIPKYFVRIYFVCVGKAKLVRFKRSYHDSSSIICLMLYNSGVSIHSGKSLTTAVDPCCRARAVAAVERSTIMFLQDSINVCVRVPVHITRNVHAIPR